MEGKRSLKNIRNVFSLRCPGWKKHAKLSLLLLSVTQQAATEQLVLFAGNSRVEKVLMIYLEHLIRDKTKFHVIEVSSHKALKNSQKNTAAEVVCLSSQTLQFGSCLNGFWPYHGNRSGFRFSAHLILMPW